MLVWLRRVGRRWAYLGCGMAVVLLALAWASCGGKGSIPAPVSGVTSQDSTLLAWQFDLAPKAERVLKHGFKIAWPKDMQVGMNLQ